MKPLFDVIKNPRVGPVIGWLLCGLAVGGFVWEYIHDGVLFDDAFITYRYARNLLLGEGLVYNPGEYVNGMYSVLWALLIACGLALGFEAQTVGYALGLTLGAATLVLTFLYANITLPRRWVWVSGLAPWIVLSSTAFPLWASSGMGVPLFTLCVTGALLAVTRNRLGWAVVAAIGATFTRPEGIIVAIVIYIYTLPIAVKASRRWVIPMTIYGLSLIGFIWFHQLYFGTPLPSGDYGFVTRDLVFLFYPHSVKGLSSVYHFLASGALLLIGPVLLSVRHDRHHRPAALYFLLAVAHLVFGPADTWRNSPFLYSALPALSAAAIHGCITSWFWNKALSLCALGSVFIAIAFQFFGEDARHSVYALAAVSLVVVLVVLRKPGPHRRLALAVSSCICACSLIVSAVLQTPVEKRWPILRVRTRTELITAERALQTSTKKSANSIEKRITRNTTAPVLATDRIGRVGYLTGYPIIDLFGRVDPTMRDIRRRYKTLKSESKIYTLITDYLLKRMPDTIVTDEKSGFDHLIAKGIIENRDFRRQYTWDSVLDSYTKRERPLMGQSAIDARLREKPKEKRPEMKPNIVLISIDTLRADHLELYDYFRRTAPHLSELARNGIFFKRAVSQAPWTLPSMATIMTSLYPFEHRSIIARSRLKDSVKTVAEELLIHGYYTMGVVSNDFLARRQGFARGFAMFDENVVKIEDEITSRTITQISTEILATADREPFFLWAHYMDPHYTYHRHPEYRFSSDYGGRFSNRITIMELLDILSKKKANNEIDLTHADFTYLRAVYDEEIAFTDAAIGTLIHFIGSMGYAHPTVFLIVADHGDFLGEHNEFGHKEYLYDELVHVPMIIGGAIDPSLRGQKVNAIVENRSVATTIMNLARIRYHPFQGYDLIESARRQGRVFEAYSETAGFFNNELEAKAAISFGEWKLIHNFKSKTYELYNIEADKGERNNLWPNRPSEEVSLRLKSRLDDFVKQIKRKRRAPKSEFKPSPSQEKSLRALGYIQ